MDFRSVYGIFTCLLFKLHVIHFVKGDLCANNPDVVHTCQDRMTPTRQLLMTVDQNVGDGCLCDVTLADVPVPNEIYSVSVKNITDSPEDCGYNVHVYFKQFSHVINCSAGSVSNSLRQGDMITLMISGNASLPSSNLCLEIVGDTAATLFTIQCKPNPSTTTLPTTQSPSSTTTRSTTQITSTGMAIDTTLSRVFISSSSTSQSGPSSSSQSESNQTLLPDINFSISSSTSFDPTDGNPTTLQSSPILLQTSPTSPSETISMSPESNSTSSPPPQTSSSLSQTSSPPSQTSSPLLQTSSPPSQTSSLISQTSLPPPQTISSLSTISTTTYQSNPPFIQTSSNSFQTTTSSATRLPPTSTSASPILTLLTSAKPSTPAKPPSPTSSTLQPETSPDLPPSELELARKKADTFAIVAGCVCGLVIIAIIIVICCCCRRRRSDKPSGAFSTETSDASSVEKYPDQGSLVMINEAFCVRIKDGSDIAGITNNGYTDLETPSGSQRCYSSYNNTPIGSQRGYNNTPSGSQRDYNAPSGSQRGYNNTPSGSQRGYNSTPSGSQRGYNTPSGSQRGYNTPSGSQRGYNNINDLYSSIRRTPKDTTVPTTLLPRIYISPNNPVPDVGDIPDEEIQTRVVEFVNPETTPGGLSHISEEGLNPVNKDIPSRDQNKKKKTQYPMQILY